MSAAFDPTAYHSALQQAQYAATAAYHVAMAPPEAPRDFIRSAWAELATRNERARVTGGPDAQLAAAREAESVMTAISQLPADRCRALGAAERRTAAGLGGYFPEEAEAAAAAIASNQTLAKFQAERDLAKKEREDEVEANRPAINARMLRDAPRDLLTVLRGRGVVLELSPDGKHITALPRHHALIEQTEIATIKERCADFLALLKAEAAAAAPMVIA